MATTKYGNSGVTPRTNVFAATEMLRHAQPVVVLEKTGKAVQMPPNKTETIRFRRPNTFSAADTPLVEGVTPTATAFTYTDVSATLQEYGQVVEITDKISDLHEDPVIADAALQAGENIGRTMEQLNYGVVKAGTSVFYANGSARANVNSVITLSKIRKVTRYLMEQKAKRISKILGPGLEFNTRAVEAAYVAVAHTDVEADIRSLPNFLPVAQYANRKPISEHECGSVEGTRFIMSPDLSPWEDAGGTAATNDTVSTTGTSSDVYPVLFFGQDAWAYVALRGEGAVDPTIIPVGEKTKDDPLGQRGYIGWKTWHAALILNQTWMSRLEVAVSNL